MNYPKFGELASENLSDATKQKLHDELASIDEDEAKDYSNPNQIENRHTREEYEKFRQDAIQNATEYDVSRLDQQTVSWLRNELASIDEDEAKDYSNPNQIGNRHTKEEYNQFRQNAIAKAFDKAKTPEPAPEPAPQPNVDIRPEPLAPVPDLDTPTPESDTLDDDIENLKKERDQIDAELAEIDTAIGQETDKTEEDTAAEAIEKERIKERERRINELEAELDSMRPNLAELYARNRRLFVGAKNRAQFRNAISTYEERLDELARLKARDTYEAGQRENSSKLASRIEELRTENEKKLAAFMNDENANRTSDDEAQERERLATESEALLRDEAAANEQELKTKVNAEFLANYLSEQNKLEDATIDKLDNGSVFRKFVDKVLNNQYLKGTLIAAGAAGLVVTGVGLAAGLAAGTMTVGLGYTAGGLVTGAAKGALAGGIMSRQNSKNSAVRGFATTNELQSRIEAIDATAEDANTENVASWLMAQYSKANIADRSSNIKRSLISAGLGAALGAVMSGVQINNVESTVESYQKPLGHEPTEIKIDKFDEVNIPKGHGAYDTFTQMGGDPNNLQKALDIMYDVDARYGLVPGSNGEVAGFNGAVGNFAHTYPGKISDWPDVAQSYIKEVADEWARQGLIPYTKTGGEPIYDSMANAVTNFIPNAFMNFLTRATTTVGAGVLGNAIGGARQRAIETESTITEQQPTEQQTEITEESATQPDTKINETNENGDVDTPENIESSPQEPTDGLRNLVLNNPAYFGGDEGVALLTGTETEPDESRFQNYWDSLDDAQKVYVRSIISGIQNSSPEGEDPAWGKAFRTWLLSQPQ